MKNLHALIVTLLLTCCAFAQQNLQNANWYFGDDAAVTFLPNPFDPQSVNTSQMLAHESCASVSDQQGNLLFYTNGLTVWNANHQVMTNGTGLLGNLSNSQMVVIPRPKYEHRYYIITIDGYSGGQKGLYYSEVNLENGLGEVVANKKNIPFRDHNGVLINTSYGNLSEKVTSTLHSNRENYWLMAQVNNNIYSYEILSSGPTINPSSTTPSPVNIVTFNNGGAGQMKISPDTKNIGIAYYGYDGELNFDGAVFVGKFNNANGLVTLNNNFIAIPNSTIYYGLEFSPKSQYMYFTANFYIYRIPVPANTTTVPTPSSIGGPQSFNGLQLALNGKIYSPTYQHLSVIDDPDDATNPNLLVDEVPYAPGTANNSLPQWIQWQIKHCEQNITLSIPETNFVPFTYKYQDYIVTNNNYSTTAEQDITMIAGEYILMDPNTSITTGSNFLAQIVDCSQYQGRPAQNTNEYGTENIKEVSKTFTVYPNPTNGTITVQFETNVNEFSVYDITGKQLMNISNSNTNEAQIDLSNLAPGVYLLTADGMPIQKIVKN